MQVKYWHANCYNLLKDFTAFHGFAHLKKDDQNQILSKSKIAKRRAENASHSNTKKLKRDTSVHFIIAGRNHSQAAVVEGQDIALIREPHNVSQDKIDLSVCLFVASSRDGF